MKNSLHLNLESFFPFIHNSQYESRTTKKQWATKKKWVKIYYNEYINEANFYSLFSHNILFCLFTFYFHFVTREFVVFLEFLIAFTLAIKTENHFKYLFYPNEWTAWTCNTSIWFNLQHLFSISLAFFCSAWYQHQGISNSASFNWNWSEQNGWNKVLVNEFEDSEIGRLFGNIINFLNIVFV